MATFKTEAGDIEIPLIFNDPALTAEMKQWRETIEQKLGSSDSEVIGLSEGSKGELLAILRKKS